jgi:rod shape-determining protein MreC
VALSRRTGGRSRITLALLILTSVAVLTLDFRDAGIVRSARNTAGAVFAPLKGVGETISEPFTNAWNGITDYGDVQAENAELRERIAELEGEQVLNEEAARQLEELAAQLELEWIGAIPPLRARVVSGAASNFEETIDIGKGSNDGIQVGMPVVNGAGLVGKVVQVTANRSTVLLLTDPDFAVGIRLPSGITGTARGQGQGKDLVVDTRLEPDSEDIPKRGTAMVTSGIDNSAFPADIPVGRVEDSEEAGDGLTLDLIVRPMADTERLAFVTVLLWTPGAGA